jgi:hypothetical protein
MYIYIQIERKIERNKEGKERKKGREGKGKERKGRHK